MASRRSVEACLEVGRGLQVLKVACGHGQFLPRLEALGLEDRVARRFMQSAAKFAAIGSNAALTKAIGSQSKLFEMLVFISPDQAKKAVAFLDQYADAVAEEQEVSSPVEAAQVRSFVQLARQVIAQRESALSTREVLERIRSRLGDEHGPEKG